MSERNYERISDLPAGVTPIDGDELVELEQDGVSRKFSMTALAGITNPHEETHQRGGADEIGTLDNDAYAIPYLDADGLIDTRVSDATTSVKGKVQLAASGEEDATKAVTGTDSRLSDARDPTAHAEQHIAGTDPIATATASNAGLMSAEDKVKADATTPANIPTADQKAALVGSYGAPGADNPFVTKNDPAILGSGATGPDLIGVGRIGDELSISGVGTGLSAMARLSDTEIAYIDSDNKQLRTYSFDGATWSLAGSGLTISGTSGPAIATIATNKIAFIDSYNEELRTYTWDGSTWSQTGSGLSVTGIGNVAIATQSANKIAFIDDVNCQMRLYSWSGSAWTEIGERLTISGTTLPKLATLYGGAICFYDETYKELRTYIYGGPWYQYGTATYVGPSGNIAVVGDSNVALVQEYTTGYYFISLYRLYGNTFVYLSGGLEISSGEPTVVNIDGSSIAVFDNTTDKLRAYNILFGYDGASADIYDDYEVPNITERKGIIIRRLSTYDGNAVTISPPSGATFEGLSSITLYGQYSYVELERISSTVFAIKAINDDFSIVPTISFSGASTGITYQYQVGDIKRAKKRCYANGRIALTSKGSSTGPLEINLVGAPLCASGINRSVILITLNGVTFSGQYHGYIGVGTNKIYLQQTTEAGVLSNLSDTNVSNTASMLFSIEYPI